MKYLFNFGLILLYFYFGLNGVLAELETGSGEVLTSLGEVVVEIVEQEENEESEQTVGTGAQIENQNETGSGEIVLNENQVSTGSDVLNNTGSEIIENSGSTVISGTGEDVLPLPEQEEKLVEIYLNEIIVNPAEGKEWIEIYNASAREIDLRGFQIFDAVKSRYTFEENSLLASKQFITIDFYNIFNNSGDQIYLKNTEENILDQFSYGEESDQFQNIKKGESMGRSPDGSENWLIYTGKNVTKNISNFAYYEVVMPKVFVEVNVESGAVLLNWENISDVNFSHYQILENRTGSGFVLLDQISENNYQFSNLENDKVYEYLIKACNQKGNCTNEEKSRKILITEFLNLQLNEFVANVEGKDDGKEWIEFYYSGSGLLSLNEYYLEIDDSKVIDLSDLSIENYLIINPYDFGVTLKNSNSKIALKKININSPIDEILYLKANEKKSWRRNLETNLWEENYHLTKNSANVLWNNNPKAFISIQGSGRTSGEGSLSVNVTAEYSYDADGDDFSCFWDYGDGSFSDKCNPSSHKYGVGEFDLKLTITDVLGGVHSIVQHISVKPKKSSGGVSIAPIFQEFNKNYSNQIKINRFLPNPEGKDLEKEWIELINLGDEFVSLDWWQIDDGEGGSKPYKIPINTWIAPKETLIFSILKTGLTLNNTKDEVRLFSPNLELKEGVLYSKAGEGEIYQRQNDGSWNWKKIRNKIEKKKEEVEIVEKIIKNEKEESGTKFKSPLDTEEKVLVKIKRQKPAKVKFASILPNPKGKDRINEYLVVKNLEDKPVNLEGWKVLNQKNKISIFPKTWLQPKEEKKLYYKDTKLFLNNTKGCLALFSSNGFRTDFLNYSDVQEGEIFTHSGGNIQSIKKAKKTKEKEINYDFSREIKGIVLSEINTENNVFWFKTDLDQEIRVQFNLQKHPDLITEFLFQKGNQLLLKGNYLEDGVFFLDDFILLRQSSVFTIIELNQFNIFNDVYLFLCVFVLGSSYWFVRKKLLLKEKLLRY